MPRPNSLTAVYTGSFDPITLGHLDVIERGSRLFDRLVVAVGINVEKHGFFSLEERVDLVKRTTSRFDNVEVMSFGGLAVDFVRSISAKVMLRGVRPLTDIAAEVTMMMANRQLAPDLETVFLLSDARLAHVSSSLIRQIAPLAHDNELEKFVPPEVVTALRKRLAQ